MLHIMTTHGGIDVRHAAQSPIAPRGRVRRGGERASEQPRHLGPPRSSATRSRHGQRRLRPTLIPSFPPPQSPPKVVTTGGLRSRHRGDGSRSSSADHKATRKRKRPRRRSTHHPSLRWFLCFLPSLPDGTYIHVPAQRVFTSINYGVFACSRKKDGASILGGWVCGCVGNPRRSTNAETGLPCLAAMKGSA